MTAAQYSRRITSIERGYLNAATQGDNPIISFVIEGRGRLDPQELERAIVVTSRANPGLSVARKGKLWLGTGEPPALEVHTTGAGEEWTDHPFLHTPLDLVHGPVASVGLISDGHVDRLVIRVSHAVADGRGIERWTDDLFRALRGEEPAGSTSTVTDQYFLPKARRRPAPDAPWASPGSPQPSPLGAGRDDADLPRWSHVRLDGDFPFMTARIISRLGDVCPGARVLVPVDLRRHDPTIDSTANLSAPLYMEARPGRGWREVQGRILRAMANGDELRAIMARFVASNPMARSLEQARSAGRDGLFPCTAIVSDHGRIDADHRYALPEWRPEAVFTLPMLVPYAAMFISSFSVNGRTSLTLGHRSSDSRQRATGFLQTIVDAVQDGEAAA